MSEALSFGACIAPPLLVLIVHRAGLAHSVRCVGNVFYGLAVGIEACRAEIRRLNAASREMR